MVQALADVATIAIIQERAISRAETLTEQLQGALNSRIVIEQAKGMIAQRHGVDVDTAFERLREHARRGQVRLADLAESRRRRHRRHSQPRGRLDLYSRG